MVRTFTGAALREIAFPLGGIGTGTVSLGGRGQLRDLEIYNRPWKNNTPRNTFFALWCKPKGARRGVAKVLEREFITPFTTQECAGFERDHNAGTPRMREATFRGEYPFAQVDLRDPDVPLAVDVETFNPFIPLNGDDSSIPCAIFKWRCTNTSNKAVEAAFLSAFTNPINKLRLGADGWEAPVYGYELGGSTNAVRANDALGMRGLWMTNPTIDPASEFAGSAAWVLLNSARGSASASASANAQHTLQTHWYQGGWWDGLQLLWNEFSETGRLPERLDDFTAPPGRQAETSQLLAFTLKPGETREFTLLFTWHLPNIRNYWNVREGLDHHESNEAAQVHNAMLRTWAGARWRDAWDVAEYVAEHLPRLEAETRAFHRAFFDSSLPAEVLDAASANASILRTTTCLRLDDGRFYAFEGSNNTSGSCPMNCTHVWNYEQALAFLFPALERTMRLTDFTHNTDADGKMAFRTLLPLASNRFWDYCAAADGQMGTILKVYREWQFSGDDDFLREVWPGVRRALAYAWDEANPHAWDRDKDGVMEGRQHNTYDIEFFGPNMMMGALYLGALKACARMATYLGEPDHAAEYQALYEGGRKKMEATLWNGEYYIQDIAVPAGMDVPEGLRSPQDPFPKYQYGKGCLSDQVLGQWLSHIAGIGDVLDPRRVRKALQSIVKYNFREDMRDVPNTQRVYALNDEAGLVIVAWPKGGRPNLATVYCDEVWTGIEYQVAAHLILEGETALGLQMVNAVRARYDGARRNPWNEVECGHHYARALASWSLVTALSGFSYSAVAQSIGFAPQRNAEQFQSFFSTGNGWGVFAQKAAQKAAQRAHATSLEATLDVQWGTLTLQQMSLRPSFTAKSARVNGQPARIEKGAAGTINVRFDQAITLSAGAPLRIELSA